MKKLLLFVLSSISIYSYAEFSANDSGNLAIAARELEEIEDNSYSFFSQDWETFLSQFQALQSDLNLIAVNQDIGLQYTIADSQLFNLYQPYLQYIFDDVRSIWNELINYFPTMQGEMNSTSVNSYNILNELYSIKENQAQRLDVNLSSLIPKDYKKEIDSAVSGITQLHDDLTEIQVEGLNVTLNGEPHVTAHIEDMPDIQVDTKPLEDKIVDFNDDFNEYVDSFEGQTVYIQGSPLWSDLNIANEDDFGMSPNQNKNGTFFENLMEMISYLHLQNASLNKSAYLTFKYLSGKETEEEREMYEEDLNSSITDIKGRMSELKLDIDDTKFQLNFDKNRDKLEIDEIFKQFPQGSNPQSVLFYIPSFGEFPAQQINVDITALSSFIEKLRIFVRMSYVILLAFIIWCLYKWLFPLLLFLINFIKKLVSVQ